MGTLSYQYLAEPFDVGFSAENQDLFSALEKGGYASVKEGRNLTIDPELLYQTLQEIYGEKLVRRYFYKHITHEHLARIKNWQFEEPERYIMLTGLVRKDDVEQKIKEV